jgi:hypothetical protein
MRFHPPKPLHGWREFGGEVGVIVIGVLIALGGEQLVTTIHSRSEANDARQAIRSELEFNMARLASRSIQKDCAERRLTDLQSLFDRTAAGAAFKSPQWVGRPQFWTMQTARWDATSQAGRAALLPAKELADYARMYTYMNSINAAIVSEQSDWARLRSLEHLHALTPQMLFDLTNSLEDARYLNWRVNVWITQLQAPADDLRLQRRQNDIQGSLSICVPMDTPRATAIREARGPYGEP